VIVAAATVVLVTAGCGTTKVIAPGGRLTVALTEYRLRPQSAEVSAGALTIVAYNYGRLTHNLVVIQNGRPQESMAPIAPGGNEQMTVFLAAGRYTLASTVQSDQALGVYGTLTVR
jgi:plastocyanin